MSKLRLSELTDRQILIHLVHKIRELGKTDARIEKRLDNHLSHMFKLAMVLVGITGSLVVALLLVLLRD